MSSRLVFTAIIVTICYSAKGHGCTKSSPTIYGNLNDHGDTDIAFPYTTVRNRRDDDDRKQCENYPYMVRNNVKYMKDQYYKVDGNNGTIWADNSTVFNMTHVQNEKTIKKTRQPIVEAYHTTQTVGSYWDERDVPIHIAYIRDPWRTVSVYEPHQNGTCEKGHWRTASVLDTAQNRHCLLAVNAGFFNTTSGECLGNIVSDGRLVQHTGGIQNAHFGVTKSGAIFFGYLTDIDIVADDFLQLVGGVLWVLKDGEVYVDESIGTECRDTQTTGTLGRFASVVSARTLVGHDREGRLMIVQVDGKTDRQGVSLYDAAVIMKKFGVINAINLDGGGSSTLVINNTLVNHPSDWCKDNKSFQCIRNVSTVLCVHEPFCDPLDCGGHGTCDLGECRCHGYWSGSSCDILKCPNDCSGHGKCSEDGCKCFPGFHEDNCSSPCDNSWYGNQCQQRCHCDNNATCSVVTGECQCLTGYTGKYCHLRCSYGYYGDNCSSLCSCEDSCSCDHVTGSCNYTLTENDFVQVGHCLQEKLQKREKLEGDMTDEYRYAIISVVVLATTTFLSITINLMFLSKYFTKWKHKNKKPKYKRAKPASNGTMFVFPQQNYSSFSTSTSADDTMEMSFIKNPSR